MSGEPSIGLGESPYRRVVQRVQNDVSDFEICEPHERVISRLPFRKKYLYVHLKEDDEGETYWEFVLWKESGDHTHWTIGK